MNEAEWLTCTDGQRMADYLCRTGTPGQRKLRLVACARARQFWHLLTDERSRTTIEVAERFADQQATTAEFTAAASAAWAALGAAARKGREASARVALSAVGREQDPLGSGIWDTAWDVGPDEEELVALQAAAEREPALLREIMGNPFRPPILDPAWRTPTVITLAEAAYVERQLPEGTLDLGCLAILADALEEAGCDNADILSHLRGPEPHWRGCWPLDLVLGKK